ncbi:hypothetical protein BV22DRAFT_9970 [Leucogyrophana mollusca]|uniref:Uncharacterized protein n=1 Tax=Leucogyrophana mollusca TaxID=85980 RepID=A0ACB8C0C1_9AGAM|nr:hypothetical protein BV22DRAFT_9970 [Leucogyrophana mollusca]
MEEKSVMVQPEVLEPPLPSSRGETETSAGKTFEEQPHATPPFDQEPRNDGAAFEEEIEVSVGAILGKRTHEETAGPEILEKINTAAEQKTVKRMKMEDPQVHVPPTTKRSTLASQKRQYKKLITPFRSPLVPKTKEQESTSRSEIAETPGFSVAQPPLPITILTPSPQPSSSTSRTHSVQPPNKTVRTQKAASQFKSPLGDSASASSAALPSIRLTPTVQTLERKLQLLKRAVKVRENGEEEVLAGLVKKWTEAGREVAWEVWDLVKDSGGDSGGTNYAAGKKAGFGESWGWDDGGGKKGGNGRDDNWGWDSAEVKREENGHEDQEMSYDSKPNQHGEDGCDEERGRDTLGTMLRQVGIAPETLGWSDDEETFIDH